MWLQISNQPFTIGFFSTFITDLPAGHLQFATLNFEPSNQETGLLDLDHLCFPAATFGIKEWSDKPSGAMRTLKKKHEKRRCPWSRHHPAIFGRSAHQIIWTKRWASQLAVSVLNLPGAIEMGTATPAIGPGLFAWAADLHHMHRGGGFIPKGWLIFFRGEATNHWSVGGFL